MITFIAKLLSRANDEVDTIHVAAMISLLAAIAVTAYATVETPMNYSPIAFCTGLGTIIGAIGGGRRLRDGRPNPGHDEPANGDNK